MTAHVPKYCKVGRTQADVDAAQRVRFRCIANELNIAVELDSHVGREISGVDNLATTHHLLLYSGQTPIGTARLALPNAEVAEASGTDLGFELEHEFALGGLLPIRRGLAEVARLCILRPWRCTAAALRLYEGLYCLSRELGVTHWIGAVDCQTSCPEEARSMRAGLEREKLTDERYRIALRQRQRPEPRGQVTESCRLASTLTTFARRLGARCIGEPSRHPAFPRYVMPMLAALDGMPASTLSMFDLSLLAPSLPEQRLHSPDGHEDIAARRMAS